MGEIHKSLARDLSVLKESRNRLVHEPSTVFGPDGLVTQGEDEEEIQPEHALEVYMRLAVYLQNLCLDNAVPTSDFVLQRRAVYRDPEESNRALRQLLFNDSATFEPAPK
jgi:hypothetical protein